MIDQKAKIEAAESTITEQLRVVRDGEAAALSAAVDAVWLELLNRLSADLEVITTQRLRVHGQRMLYTLRVDDRVAEELVARVSGWCGVRGIVLRLAAQGEYSGLTGYRVGYRVFILTLETKP